MGLFNIFKKKKKEVTNMSTLDEVRKAYDELSDDDKKKFSQSIAEAAPESGAEQEKGGGTEDKKPAEERETPAPAEERAEESGDETGGDKETVEPEPAATDGETWRKDTDARLARIEEMLGQLTKQGKRTPAPADGETAERLKRAENIYS